MLCTHVLMTFKAIKQFPGEDLEGLAGKIRNLYPQHQATAFLAVGEGYEHTLESRIRELDCIEVRDKRYYFKPDAKVYSIDPTLNRMIAEELASEKNAQEKSYQKPLSGG